MPRFPYLSSIFLLLSLVMAAVIVPNKARILPPVQQVESDLSTRFDGAVKIDGDVRLRFLPRPQLIIDKVSFSDSKDAEALFAATIPRLVIDLNMTELVQGRFSSRSFALLRPNVQMRLADRPAALLAGLHGISSPPIDILNGDFRIIGLDPLRPSHETKIAEMSIKLAGKQADGTMSLLLQKSLSSGQIGQLRLTIGAMASETQINLTLGLGINEQFQFNGFLSGLDAQWRLDGEVELMSDNMLANAIEARLPVSLLPDGRRLALSGLVRGSSSGLRSDSLEIEALNTIFRARMALNWPRRAGETPMLDGRLSTGSVNLDLMRPNFDLRTQALLGQLWRTLAPDLAISMTLEATRFTIGGETGSDLSADIEQKAEILRVQRLNLNLPFRSSLLASGRFSLADENPAFEGNFSARSSDTLALLLWLGNRYGVDFSALAETVDEAQFQRTSLVGDVTFDNNGLDLKGLAGRLGDDYFSSEIKLSDLAVQEADIMFNINRLDLADWGIVTGGSAARDGGLVSVWPQINRLLGDLMHEANARRLIDFDINVGRVFADTRRIGSARIEGRLNDRALELETLHLANFDNADIRLAGRVNYDAALAYGTLALSAESDSSEWLREPIFSLFAPLDFTAAAASRLAVEINLTAPESADWPKVLYSATGDIGGAELDLTMSTPTRSLAYVESGTEMKLALKGAANDMARLFLLPASYNDAALGDMRLDLTASGNDLFSLATDMVLANDRLALNGTLRAGTGGNSLAGALEFDLAQFLPLLAPASDWSPVAARGKVQLIAAPENISFSGLEMNFSGGRVSGEGVLQSGDALPRLNMNMAVENVDLSWLLPMREAENWNEGQLRWALFGRSNADIQLRAINSRFGPIMLDNLSGRLKLTEGVLEAPEVTLNLLGGTMTANVLAEGGFLTPRFAINAQFTEINPTSLIAAQYGNALVDAPVSGSLMLEGRGSSARAVMAALSGELNFEISPGNLTFFDAVGFADAARIANFAGDANTLVAQHTGLHRLSFARGLGRANLRNGVLDAASADFVFADGLNEARLEAAMDMVGLKVDAAFALYPLDRQRPVIWRVSGDFEKPIVEIDASAFNANSVAPSATPPPAR